MLLFLFSSFSSLFHTSATCLNLTVWHHFANKRCKCTSNQVMYVCWLSDLRATGCVSRCTRPVYRGKRGKVIGAWKRRESCGPPGTPHFQWTRKRIKHLLSHSLLFLFYNAIPGTLNSSHPSTMAFFSVTMAPFSFCLDLLTFQNPSVNWPHTSDAHNFFSLLTLIKISFATALISSVEV